MKSLFCDLIALLTLPINMDQLRCFFMTPEMSYKQQNRPALITSLETTKGVPADYIYGYHKQQNRPALITSLETTKGVPADYIYGYQLPFLTHWDLATPYGDI